MNSCSEGNEKRGSCMVATDGTKAWRFCGKEKGENSQSQPGREHPGDNVCRAT